MEGSSINSIYQQLTQEYNYDQQEDNQDINAVYERMGNIINSMIQRIDHYEQEKADNIHQLKKAVSELITGYMESSLQEELGAIVEERDSNRARFQQIAPQMEALTQMRNIYRQSFTNFSTRRPSQHKE